MERVFPIAREQRAQLVLFVLGVLLCIFTAGSAHADDEALPGRDSRHEEPVVLDSARIVERARLEVARAVKYAGTWQRTSGYPMGDIPADRGACTDLVVRSLRAANIDLQRLVHEDVVAQRVAYGIDRPDRTIDHRRVSTLLTFFERKAPRLPTDARNVKAFEPGDVVFFGPKHGSKKAWLHVGIISDRVGRRGLPLVLENGGPRPVESDSLDRRPILGHFRAQFSQTH
jgi:uncharacterized protein YijF (DUF1287 family)